MFANIRIGAVSMALIPCYIFLQFCTTIKKLIYICRNY